MATRAYSYTRFSTPEQASGDSLERQVSAARKLAEENGWVLEELTDPGISAYRGANRITGALGDFLRLSEAGEIPRGSVLIVENLDRLSRERVLDALNLFQSILRTGIEVYTLTDGKHYTYDSLNSDFTSLMMSLLMMSRAHEESALKSERLSGAWERKRSRVGEAKLTARCPAWLELSEDKKVFHPIPERIQILKRIFEETAAGMGAAAIARTLNREGVPTWGRGKLKADGWQPSYIKKILLNRAVLGYFQPHKKPRGEKAEPVGEEIPDYYPEVVSPALYEAARVARQGRRHSGGRRGRAFSNLLTGGITKCAACSRSMRFLDKGPLPKGGRYMRCSGAVRGLCDNTRMYRYRDIEYAILRFVRETDYSSILRDSDSNEKIKKYNERMNTLKHEKKECERRRKNLLDGFADNPDDDIKEMISGFGKEIERIENEVENINNELGKLVSFVDEFEDNKEKIVRMVNEDGDYEFRASVNQALRNVISEIVFKPSGQINVYIKNSSIMYTHVDLKQRRLARA